MGEESSESKVKSEKQEISSDKKNLENGAELTNASGKKYYIFYFVLLFYDKSIKK